MVCAAILGLLQMKIGKELIATNLGEINKKYPKTRPLHFIKRINWILPTIVKRTILELLTFYTDASNLGMSGYMLEKNKSNSKPICLSSKLSCMPLILLYFPESLNIVTDSICRMSCM